MHDMIIRRRLVCW